MSPPRGSARTRSKLLYLCPCSWFPSDRVVGCDVDFVTILPPMLLLALRYTLKPPGRERELAPQLLYFLAEGFFWSGVYASYHRRACGKWLTGRHPVIPTEQKRRTRQKHKASSNLTGAVVPSSGTNEFPSPLMYSTSSPTSTVRVSSDS